VYGTEVRRKMEESINFKEVANNLIGEIEKLLRTDGGISHETLDALIFAPTGAVVPHRIQVLHPMFIEVARRDLYNVAKILVQYVLKNFSNQKNVSSYKEIFGRLAFYYLSWFQTETAHMILRECLSAGMFCACDRFIDGANLVTVASVPLSFRTCFDSGRAVSNTDILLKNLRLFLHFRNKCTADCRNESLRTCTEMNELNMQVVRLLAESGADIDAFSIPFWPNPIHNEEVELVAKMRNGNNKCRSYIGRQYRTCQIEDSKAFYLRTPVPCRTPTDLSNRVLLRVNRVPTLKEICRSVVVETKKKILLPVELQEFIDDPVPYVPKFEYIDAQPSVIASLPEIRYI
jgi:hypothetical protein